MDAMDEASPSSQLVVRNQFLQLEVERLEHVLRLLLQGAQDCLEKSWKSSKIFIF